MDRLQKLGRVLGYEGKDLQDFVGQENKRERDERAAEREIEKAKIALEEAKIAQQREIELANVKAEEARSASLFSHMQKADFLTMRLILLPSSVTSNDRVLFIIKYGDRKYAIQHVA